MFSEFLFWLKPVASPVVAPCFKRMHCSVNSPVCLKWSITKRFVVVWISQNKDLRLCCCWEQPNKNGSNATWKAPEDAFKPLYDALIWLKAFKAHLSLKMRSRLRIKVITEESRAFRALFEKRIWFSVATWVKQEISGVLSWFSTNAAAARTKGWNRNYQC